MIAAIYARKSTDQSGMTDETKSVTRQVDHARNYAGRRGWTVSDALVFTDDGISGAEFATRPGFLRLMNALKPRPEFHVLVMSEESRLGREAIETAYALKQIIQAGVRVFFYLEDRERTLDSPSDKLMMSVTAFADELEREKARQRTYDAMQRKARAGHVTGGRVFGYNNVDVEQPGPDGQLRRAYVERRINEGEAAVVRDIFERFASGEGLPSIAKALNQAGAPSPRAQQGRPNGWAPSSIREVLRRPLYRGEVVWNRTRKRDQWGRKRQRERDPSEWLVHRAPELRIVDETQWLAVEHAIVAREARYLAATRGRRGGRPPASGTKYLLTGLLRCECCGSSLEARTRDHGSRRAVFYACSGYHRRGVTVCRNRLCVPAEALELAVLGAIERRLLTPAVIEAALDQVEAALRGPSEAESLSGLRSELETLAKAIRRLSDAIAAGGNLTGLLDALKSREARKSEVERLLELRQKTASCGTTPRPSREALRARLSDWKGLLRRQVPEGRELLKQLIVGRLTCRPHLDCGFYEFSGVATFAPVIGGLVPQNVASPAGFEPASPP